MTEPTCGKCGKVMTPQDSRIHPEYFLHDACLPDAKLARPKDVYGNDVEVGPWYWAKSRTGKIVGAGKFASVIGSNEVTWFINGTGYGPEGFTFLRVNNDPAVWFSEAKESRREAALKQSYDNLAASGGIVDAP